MCDTLCVRRSGGTLFAKSSDRPVDEAQVLRWYHPRPAGGTVRATHVPLPDTGASGVLGSQPTWMWGFEHGVNQHRVAVGNEKVWTTDDPRAAAPALTGMDLVRLGLERGRSADGAVDAIVSLLEAHGQGGTGEEDHDEPYWSSFLVVDPGGGWIVETSGRSWVAQPVEDGAAISNRICLSTGWTRSSGDVEAGSDWDRRRDPTAPVGIADGRLATTRGLVDRGADVSLAEVVATLRDHGSGPWGAVGAEPTDVLPVPPDVGEDWGGVTVCMHVRDFQCTTASMVAELPDDHDDPIRLWASLGTPCTGMFLPIAVLDDVDDDGPSPVVPSVLGDPVGWRAFAALARRAEAPGDEGRSALAAIRDRLAPIEASAWHQAEDLWAGHADRTAWTVAAARWDEETRAALRALR